MLGVFQPCGRPGPLDPVGGRLLLLAPKLLLGVDGNVLDEDVGVTLLPPTGALKPDGCDPPKPGLKPVPDVGVVEPLGNELPEPLGNELPPVDMAGELNRDGLLVLLRPPIEPLPIEPDPIVGLGGNDGGGWRVGVLLHPHSSIPPTSKAPILNQGLDPIRFLLTP